MVLCHTPGIGLYCQGRGDPPVPRPSGSSASPGFSSSTMGSECSLRMSLPSTERALALLAPAVPSIFLGSLSTFPQQYGREVTATVAMQDGGWERRLSVSTSRPRSMQRRQGCQEESLAFVDLNFRESSNAISKHPLGWKTPPPRAPRHTTALHPPMGAGAG